MLLKQLIKIIEQQIPPTLAYSWDNVGLLVGDPKADIKTILVTLDVNSVVAEEAKAVGADLILSHHPIFLNGMKAIRTDTEDGKLISILMKNNIAVYAAHTNLDVASGGINSALSEKFKLQNVSVLTDEIQPDTGLGRIGDLESPMTLSEFATLVKKVLHTPAVRISGDADKMIRRVAIGSGACGDCIPIAKQKSADVMLTADVKYHTAIDAVLSGIAVVDAGHYPTEMIAMDLLKNLLDGQNLNIIFSKNQDIFRSV